ncbi:hypothetical protein MP228_009002 [Amoeboaphelidium protococcarum]|nr:hypothetical protein MP228_009002 [Amoeboaphelidium protococcarum]
MTNCDSLDMLADYLNKPAKDADNTIDASDQKQLRVIYHDKSQCGLINVESIFKDTFAIQLRQALQYLEWQERSNDLYHFYQSTDFKHLDRSDPNLQPLCQLHNLIKCNTKEFVKFLLDLNGISGDSSDDTYSFKYDTLIEGKFDMAAQRYDPGNYLLCHDDDIAESDGTVRKLAFVIYLVSDDYAPNGDATGESYNGKLKFYGNRVDQVSQRLVPVDVVQSVVYPRFNSIVMFEVGRSSFHCVDTMPSTPDTRSRYSISGWFYAQQTSDPPQMTATGIFSNDSNQKLVLPAYCNDKLQSQIQDKFMNESVVQLNEFFSADAMKLLNEQMQKAALYKPIILDVSRSKYHLFDPQSAAGQSVKSIEQYFKGDSFIEILQKLSGLQILKDTANVEYKVFCIEDYQMIDSSKMSTGDCLDLYYFVDCSDNEHLSGDSENASSDNTSCTVVYVSGEQTLVQLCAPSNTLVLVYNTGVEQDFVRLIKNKSSTLVFKATYVLQEHDDDDDDDEEE